MDFHDFHDFFPGALYEIHFDYLSPENRFSYMHELKLSSKFLSDQIRVIWRVKQYLDVAVSLTMFKLKFSLKIFACILTCIH